MNWDTLPHLIPYLASLLITSIVGVYAWRQRDSVGAVPFTLVTASQALWTLGYVWELIDPTLEGKIFWDNVQFIGAVGWPISFLALAVEYSGRKLPRPRLVWGATFGAAVLYLLLVFTDDYHHWIRPDARLVPGAPFSALTYAFTLPTWLVFLYMLGMFASGFAVLVATSLRSHPVYRAQFILIIVGASVPLVGVALTILGVTLTFQRDTSPITFALSNLILAWGLFRYQLFDLAPIARDVVMEGIGDSVFVLDARDRVVDVNPAALRVVGGTAAAVIGQPASAVLPRHLAPLSFRVPEVRTEMVVADPASASFLEVSLAPLRDRRGKLAGRALIAHDITRLKQAEAALRQSRDELEQRVQERTAELSDANAALRASEERFSKAFHASLAAISISTVDEGRFLDVNESFLSLLGYSREDVIGHTAAELNTWPDPAARGRAVQLLREHRTAHNLDLQFRTQSGEMRDCLTSLELIELGGQACLLGLVHDVTERKRAEVALQRYTARLESLHAMDRAILAAQSPEEIASAALSRIRTLVPCWRASVAEFDLVTGHALILAASVNGETQSGVGAQVPLEYFGDLASFHAGQPYQIEDLQTLADRAAIMEQTLAQGTRSAISVPLVARGELIGALNLEAVAPAAFGAEHVEITREIAAQLAIAIQQARLFEAERAARQQADVLRAANLALTQTLDLDTILETLLDHLGRLVPYDTASVMLRHGESRLAVRAVSAGTPGIDLELIRDWAADVNDYGNLRTVIATRQSLMIADTHVASDWVVIRGAEYIRSWLGVPLMTGGHVIGLYSLAKAEANSFTPEHQQLAEALAAQATVAIQNARLFEQVHAGREQLQALSHRLVEVQEAERRHLARELHDEIGQTLTGLKLVLQVVPRLPAEAAQAKLQDAIKLVNELTERAHDLSLDLRPAMLDDFGLPAALLWLFERFQAQSGMRVNSEFIRLEERLPAEVETTAYRIVQEALTNAARHAQVSDVNVRLMHNGTTLRIQVQDAGKGFDVAVAMAAGKRAGLAGMHERALLLGGWVRVDSTPGAGTQVMAVLPLAGRVERSENDRLDSAGG